MIERGYVGRALQIVATNLFEYLLAGALMGALVVATAGILVGPAAGGIAAMTLKRCRGEEIDMADAFRGFENFGSTLLVGVAVAAMVLLGSFFLIVPGLVLAALFGYALPAAVDRPVSPAEALKQARILAAQDLLGQTIFAAALLALAFSGAVFLLVGMCVTVPLALAALTIAYHDAAYPPTTARGASDPAPPG